MNTQNILTHIVSFLAGVIIAYLFNFIDLSILTVVGGTAVLSSFCLGIGRDEWNRLRNKSLNQNQKKKEDLEKKMEKHAETHILPCLYEIKLHLENFKKENTGSGAVLSYDKPIFHTQISGMPVCDDNLQNALTHLSFYNYYSDYEQIQNKAKLLDLDIKTWDDQLMKDIDNFVRNSLPLITKGNKYERDSPLNVYYTERVYSQIIYPQLYAIFQGT